MSGSIAVVDVEDDGVLLPLRAEVAKAVPPRANAAFCGLAVAQLTALPRRPAPAAPAPRVPAPILDPIPAPIPAASAVPANPSPPAAVPSPNPPPAVSPVPVAAAVPPKAPAIAGAAK